MLVTNNNN